MVISFNPNTQIKGELSTKKTTIMTEVRLTSEEYEKLYSVYVCASNLVSHKDEFELKELNECFV